MTRPGEALREALTQAGFLDAYLNIRGVKDEAEAWVMLSKDWARLAESGFLAAPVAGGLDVERLAAALDVVFEKRWDKKVTPGWTTIHGGYARDIAREYAARAASQPVAEEGDA